MKKVITMLVLGVAIFSTVILGGCSKADPTISKTETPYSVVKDADVQYLTEQHPDVVKVKETVEGYIKALTTIDYKTSDGMEAYEYLSQGMIDALKKKNDIEETLKFLKDNSLVMQFDSLKIDSIKFNNDMNKAEVKGSFRNKYTEATDSFFKDSCIQKGAIYERGFSIDIEKQSEIWKISNRGTDPAKLISQ